MGRVTGRLVVGTVAATVGCLLPAGHSLGVINTPEQVMRAWLSESYSSRGWRVAAQQEVVLWSAVVTSFVAGAAVGAGLSPWLVDRVGRKLSLLVTEVLALVSGGLFLSCYAVGGVELLLLGRAAAGLSAGMATSAAGLYLSEICPPSASGVFSAIVPVGITLGMLIAYLAGLPSLLGNACRWPLLLSAHLLYVAVGLLLLPFAPESPAYSGVVVGDAGSARDELLRLRGASEEREVAKELAAMSARRGADAGAWTLGRIARSAELRRRLGFVVLLNAGQQLSGINAVFFYSTMVFRSAGLCGEQVVAATFCVFLANIAMAVLALPLLRYFRRRVLLNISMVGTIACFVTLVAALSQVHTGAKEGAPVSAPESSPVATPAVNSALTSVEGSHEGSRYSVTTDGGPLGANTTQEAALAEQMQLCAQQDGGWAGRVALAATVFYVVAYGIGMGPVPYSYAADVFPAGPRSVALALGGATNWGTNCAVGLLFPPLQFYLQFYSFLFFIAFTLVLLVVLQKLPGPCTPDRRTPPRMDCPHPSHGGEALCS